MLNVKFNSKMDSIGAEVGQKMRVDIDFLHIFFKIYLITFFRVLLKLNSWNWIAMLVNLSLVLIIISKFYMFHYL